MTDPVEPTVVCSILERDVAAVKRRLRQVPAGCSLVEIRGDRLRAEEVAGLVGEAGRDVVVTVRPAHQDGWFEGSEGERRDMLRQALAAGARFVDVEFGSGLEDLADGDQAARVILSDHGAPCRSAELQARYRAMASRRAARLKLVPVARSPAEAGAVRHLLAAARWDDRPLACFASGRAGAVSRIMAPSWGSWATYGSVAPGAESAEGQFTARDLLEVHDVRGVGPATRRFALVGGSVFGSPSPAMHVAAYRQAGLDARYLPLELDRLEASLPLLGREGAVGIEALAVTMPFKEEACARCDTLDPVARASGAVNTVVVGPGGWSGFNTDGPALLALVRERLDPSGASVAVVGAGGMARAAGAVLTGAGAKVRFFNRTPERAVEAARRCGGEAAAWDRLADARWEVLVQATPLGGAGQRRFDPDRLHGKMVIDAVYGPETALVRHARARGLHVLCGFDLLVAQAVLQHELMTGIRPAEELLRRAGDAWLASRTA